MSFFQTNQKENDPFAAGDLLHLYHRSKACIVCRAFRSALKPTKANLLGLGMVFKKCRNCWIDYVGSLLQQASRFHKNLLATPDQSTINL